ncbi:MAG TPA: Uma2 family endonuclease [Pyrinomonadaceae bacterium]|jgi:Uma2 family endonuclease
MSVQIAKRWFTVAEYNRMSETGILTEDDRVELIEGEIVEMSPIGRRHAACVDRLTELLSERLQRKAIVRVQSPIVLNEYTEPQPDVALLRRREDFYERSLPTPADVLLVVEVADTTLDYDRQIKVPLYARAGISEVWIVNLHDEQVEVYTRPAGGAYQDVRLRGRGEAMTSAEAPSLTLSVDEILG